MKIKMLLDNCFDPDIRVYKEANYLVKNQNEVEIICLDKKNKYKDKPTENIDGILIRRFFPRTEGTTNLIEKNFIIRKLKYFIYIWWLFKFLFQVKEYLKNEQYDILYCHDLTMAFFANIILRNKNIVFDMHEYYKDKRNNFINFFIDKIVRYTQNKSKWIVYVNEHQKNDVKEKNLNKLIYLPNYPLEEDYLPIEKEKASKIRVNYIGFLRDYNSLKNLINVSEKNDMIEVGLYGGGDCLETLKNEQFSDRVHIYGLFNGKTDSARIYRNTDILYCVYNPEDNNWKNAYPVKLFEGVVTKTPIIVSKNSKAGEFIEEFCIGEAVTYNDMQDLESAIMKIKNNYPKYLDNLEKIRNNYMWNDVAKNLNEMLTSNL